MILIEAPIGAACFRGHKQMVEQVDHAQTKITINNMPGMTLLNSLVMQCVANPRLRK